MRRLSILLLSALCLLACGKTGPDPQPKPDPQPVPVPQDGKSDISYQLLVYSFADSDSDLTGDFKGIESKLDYLAEMGVQAVWLSPVHPATSYHGYDVEDYGAVNPQYGTMSDFQSLLDAAHSKGIKVYIDYVLNHTSKNHPWFQNATSSADSPYRDYYMISKNPQADVKAGKFPMMPASSYNSGEWTRVATGSFSKEKMKFTLSLSSGKPSSIRADKVDEIVNTGTRDTGIWLYYSDGKMEQFYSDGSTVSLSLEIQSDWGVLVRTSQDGSWPVGTKYGAQTGANLLDYGTSVKLYPSTSSFDPADILLPGMDQNFYLSVFGSYMPDVNYGAAADCENSAPFRELTEAADKWIRMGVDGFRLDAVKHIYHNASSDENPTFLKKFYDHCNATYKSCGRSDNIYMVGEHFSEPREVAPYYKGLPAYFEFGFWWRLIECINSSNIRNFASTINSYHQSYAQNRTDWIAATKLTNHDEDRAMSLLGRDAAKAKLAAAVLLTCAGNPYIYQGEELGYYGTRTGGDAYVRTPVKWTASGPIASGALDGQIDNGMLTADISVERQSGDPSSMLSLYRQFGRTRAVYKALSRGDMVPVDFSKPSIAAWTREYESQKVLVIHNFLSSPVSIQVKGYSLDNCIESNGQIIVQDSGLLVGGYASAVYLQ
ncbi:MAG: alpha-amylase family glycosyl hydrolase [Bacteroidales bacterium]|nr:alpha-amylase family glycosyl hydrolase [Bacteroidales bacterium]